MSNFHIKSDGPVVIVTLPDRSFSTWCEAIERLSKLYGDQKIFFMQTIEKKDEPLKFLVVFELEDKR